MYARKYYWSTSEFPFRTGFDEDARGGDVLKKNNYIPQVSSRLVSLDTCMQLSKLISRDKNNNPFNSAFRLRTKYGEAAWFCLQASSLCSTVRLKFVHQWFRHWTQRHDSSDFFQHSVFSHLSFFNVEIPSVKKNHISTRMRRVFIIKLSMIYKKETFNFFTLMAFFMFEGAKV